MLVGGGVCAKGRVAEDAGWKNNPQEKTCEQGEVQGQVIIEELASAHFQTAKVLAPPELLLQCLRSEEADSSFPL